MTGREYVELILEQLAGESQISSTVSNGAFLAAAMAIINEVESPLKEEALVQLAVTQLRSQRKNELCGRRAA